LQLAAQHMNSPPLLDPLPLADRPVIARALAKAADQRFPSCRELVEALFKAQADSTSSAGLGRSAPIARTIDSPTPGIRRVTPPATDSSEEDLLNQKTIANFSLQRKSALAPADQQHADDRLSTTSNPLARPKAHLRPTLFLGVGGLAGLTLRSLRQKLTRHFGSLSAVPIFRFLQIDTDRSGLRTWQQGLEGDMADPEESLLLPLYRPEHYRAEAKDLLRWLDRRRLYGIPRSLLTEGIRPLGRLAFATNSADWSARVRDGLQTITSPEAKAAAVDVTGLTLRSDAPRVFLVAGINGGTGGGMLVDMGRELREILGDLDLSWEGLCAMMIHASGDKPGEVDLARVNAYATLTELNHFSRKDSDHASEWPPASEMAEESEAPFHDCYLLHLGEHLSQSEINAGTESLAEYLYLDTAAGAGDFLDHYRQATRKNDRDSATDLQLRTCGVSKLAFPRHAIAHLATPSLCRQLLRRWLQAGGPALEESFKAAALRQAAAAGLEAQSLVDRLHALVRDLWDEEPDKYLQRNLTDWLHEVGPLQRENGRDFVLTQLLAKIADIVGHDTPGAANSYEPKPVEVAIRNEAQELAAKVKQEVVLWLSAQVDGHKGRLQVVDYAARCLLQQLTFLIESATYLLEQGRKNQKFLRVELADADFSAGGSSSRWLGLSRRPPAKNDPMPRLMETCRLRLKQLVLENVIAIFRAVSNDILKFKQELGLIRVKLEHLADTFADQEAARKATAGSDGGATWLTWLFPKGQSSVLAAVEALRGQMETELLPAFEDELCSEVLKPPAGFWSLLDRQSDRLDKLRSQMESRARAAVLGALQQINAAGLFLESDSASAVSERVLAGHIQGAAPQFMTPDSWHHLVMALPRGRASEQLKAMIAAACPGEPTTTIPSDGDVVLCFEATHLNLGVIAGSFGSGEKEFYNVARQAMTRTDVSWSLLAQEPSCATVVTENSLSPHHVLARNG
jgi:hypothetical protein